mgnify:CR=1 FL=1
MSNLLKKPSEDQVKRLPKALLHDHLDGGLRPQTIIDIAKEIGHTLPTYDAAELAEWFRSSCDSGSLVLYLETFAHTVAVMQRREDIVRVSRECAVDLARDGVVYAEVRGAPELFTEKGLSMADVERKVVELATKARDNKLTLEEMQGGTFTITNGGVFGSLMSTPIINIPQSAILGMHKIEERAMVVNGQIVAKPMMYLALSYDHRIIDGRESVGFLVRVKELLENPALLLFGKDPVKALLEL